MSRSKGSEGSSRAHVRRWRQITTAILVALGGSVLLGPQTAGSADATTGWSNWSSMAGTWGNAGQVVARNADGRLQVFLVGQDRQLYTRYQTAPNGGFNSSWLPMGGTWSGTPAVASNADGGLQVFLVGQDGQLYTRYQTVRNGGFNQQWVSLGGSLQHSGSLAVGSNADGRLQVFVVGTDSQLYTSWQTVPTTALPGPPQNVTATPHNGSAFVSWQAPSSDGGSPIQSYTITTVPGNAKLTVPADGISATVYGLAADCSTEYSFKVQATNATGTGPFSMPSLPVRTSGVVSGSAPDVAVILLDGAPSTESGGSYYPIPVPSPASGVPMVMSYCPTPAGDTATMFAFPPGLHDNLWRWDEFPVSGSSSGGGSTPQHGTACLDSAILTNCLTAPLAAKGVVFFPYSYTGASLRETATGPQFTVNGYGASDSSGGVPLTQVARLEAEICSINQTWPFTNIVLIGHSYGGLLAMLWWHDDRGQMATRCGPISIPNGNVHYVFSLDSPINGIAHPATAGLFGGFSKEIKGLWLGLWANKGSIGPQQILPLDSDGSYIAVGTEDDSTYAQGDFPFAGIDSQLVATGCFASFCTFAGDPPNYKSPCSASQTVDGITEHDMVKICPQVIGKIAGLVEGLHGGL